MQLSSIETAEDSEDETIEDYKVGGYHPVHVGEIFLYRYIVIQKLGWGHFSTVWLAKDLKYNSYVALKVQKSAPQYLEAAYDEVEILEQVSSYWKKEEWMQSARKYLNLPPEKNPNMDSCCCVQLLNSFLHFGQNGKHFVMVFEIMGVNLLDIIRRYEYKGIPIPLVRAIAKQSLIGLDYLHRICQIIHTDIKPENVLLSLTAEQIQEIRNRGQLGKRIKYRIPVYICGMEEEEKKVEEKRKPEKKEPRISTIQTIDPETGRQLTEQELTKKQKKNLKKKRLRKKKKQKHHENKEEQPIPPPVKEITPEKKEEQIKEEKKESIIQQQSDKKADIQNSIDLEKPRSRSLTNMIFNNDTGKYILGNLEEDFGLEIEEYLQKKILQKKQPESAQIANQAPEEEKQKLPRVKNPITENVQVKIVDLGNGCWTYHHFTSRIQTRQYRSPEV